MNPWCPVTPSNLIKNKLSSDGLLTAPSILASFSMFVKYGGRSLNFKLLKVPFAM